MTLEQRLRRSAEGWLAEAVLSPDRSAQLERLVRQRAGRRQRNRWVRVAAVAATVASVGFFWPVMVSVASDIPGLGEIIARWAGVDRGIEWAAENGYVIPVGKSATDKGYTFRVESVTADAARTEIHYVIEGPGLTPTMLPPRIDCTFNNLLGAGESANSFVLEDGRLLGHATLPPLPHPIALVGLTVPEIAGVQGNWTVSFLASRTELDKLTRTVDVPQALRTGDAHTTTPPPPASSSSEQTQAETAPAPHSTQPAPSSDPPEEGDYTLPDIPLTPTGEPPLLTDRTIPVESTWKGDNFSIVVKRLLLAPTETVVELNTIAPGVFSIRGYELVANGKPVPFKRGNQRFDGYSTFVFDRLDGDPAEVTFRVKRLFIRQQGGPVIDLGRPGVRSTYDNFWFEPEPLRIENGESILAIRYGTLDFSPPPPINDPETFSLWRLMDAEGDLVPAYTTGYAEVDPDSTTKILEFHIPGEIQGLSVLKAMYHAVPVPGEFEVTIPLK